MKKLTINWYYNKELPEDKQKVLAKVNDSAWGARFEVVTFCKIYSTELVDFQEVWVRGKHIYQNYNIEGWCDIDQFEIKTQELYRNYESISLDK